MKRRVVDHKLEDKYVPVGISLCDLYFEEKLSFGATGNVAVGSANIRTSKSAFEDRSQYAMKLIDRTKVPNAKEIFQREIEAYKRLEHLQGKVIPTFKGAFVASNFVFVILLEHCGVNASVQDLLANIDRLPVHFQHIHALGVVQGDVARRNILIRQGHLYVIDFGYCKFKEDDEIRFHELCKEEMENVSRLLNCL
jgi:RIO-like serine/threonine protein kinase